jgi:hypothetical protein
MRRLFLPVVLGAFALIMLTALFLTRQSVAAESAAPPGEARIRVVHASPDAPNVDVWVDGTPALTNVPFTAVSDYTVLSAASHLIQVEPAGAGGAGPFVISATVPLAADTDYTIAAVGELAAVEPLVLTDNNAIPAEGKAHVRFVHASPDAPAVDITLTDGTVLFGDYAFKETSPYTPVDAGTYDLQVRLAGTSTVVLELPGIALTNKTVYTVFAMGFATPGMMPGLQAVLSEDAALANVRIAHLSPDAPAVDIRVNGSVAIPNVAFEEVTDYVALPSDAYFVEVVPAGSPGPVVISATLDLAPNQDYTVAAVGELAAIEPLVLQDDNTIPGKGTAHVRFVHASPDAPAVDITLPDGTILFGDYAFKESSPYLPVPTGVYTLEVRLAGTSTVVLTLNGLQFAQRTVYTAYATGFAGGGAPALNAILSEDAGTAWVKVAHLSPDAPDVDVWVDGQLAFTDLGFEELTGYAPLPFGMRLVQVEPAGSNGAGPFVISATVDLASGTDYTIAAVGELASIEPLVLEDNNSVPAIGSAHVRFVHASPDAPAVDITLPDGTVLFGDYAFKESSAFLPVNWGSYDLEVRLAGTSTVVLALSDIPLDNQDVYTVFATGFAGGGNPPLNALLARYVDTSVTHLPLIFR